MVFVQVKVNDLVLCTWHHQAEAEAERLNVLKVSKMKELVLAKQRELEQIYQGVHLDFESHAADQLLYTIDCGQLHCSLISSFLSCFFLNSFCMPKNYIFKIDFEISFFCSGCESTYLVSAFLYTRH